MTVIVQPADMGKAQLPGLAVLPDVNLFLQCRGVKGLPWSDLAEEGPITLYVGPTLAREIDRLKGDGNGRRARRARETNSLFKELLNAVDETVILREAAPRVILKFLPLLDPSREKSATLDITSADDCHIEEALAFRTASDTRTAILTHDTGPLLTARRHNLEAIMVPDSWLLEPEKDDRQKQIEELKSKVRLLENQHPLITICSLDSQASTIEELCISVTEFAPASPDLIASVLADLRSENPLKEDFSEPSPQLGILRMLSGRYQPPAQREVDLYRHEYQSWIRNVEVFLGSLSERLKHRSRFARFLIRIENVGTRPANAVQVDFSSSTGFVLQCLFGDERGNSHTNVSNITFPKKPEPPEGIFISLPDALNAALGLGSPGKLLDQIRFPGLFVEQRQDPTEFYRKRGTTQTCDNSISLTCSTFRHRLGAKEFNLEVEWKAEPRSIKGVILCRISAENLPEPVERKLPVRVVFEQGDIKAEIERYRRLDVLSSVAPQT